MIFSTLCRGYILRAINAHGGFGAVAGQIGWDMAYNPKRPRGYWNSILNVKSEVDDFIQANALQPGVVPSLREVRGADRYSATACTTCSITGCAVFHCKSCKFISDLLDFICICSALQGLQLCLSTGQKTCPWIGATTACSMHWRRCRTSPPSVGSPVWYLVIWCNWLRSSCASVACNVQNKSFVEITFTS